MVKVEFVVTYQKIDEKEKYNILKKTFEDLRDAILFKKQSIDSGKYKNVDIIGRSIIEILL
ncbi:hypothetical protein Q3304_18815 [Clostridioides sp. GD02377]|uniref:hypothetical protein n=1 Tax=unclassified Clostridioides TaxID=2635829 RepID=UPI0038A1A7CB